MPLPPAEPFASRTFLGPALRTQPDRRLVKLVREGYEGAFEEIVRRYRRPLDRFAAAIVGDRSEDVTQDALSKALLALRGSEKEIELRPWLYRIVRNTALNDLRDRPPAAEQLAESIAGGESAAATAERHEEIADLIERLRALPKPQRAAIVMRELEGLSHEEIAAALGVSGGAARQAIYRARAALRDGFGLLIPLPLLRMLFDHGTEAAAAGGAAAATGAAAIGGGGATLGGLSAGGALKVGVATALVAGSVGAGVAVQQSRDGGDDPPPAAASVQQPSGESASGSGSGGSSGPSGSGDGPDSPGSNSSGPGSDGRGDNRNERRGRDDDRNGPGGRETDDLEEDRSGKGSSGRSKSGSGSGDDDRDDREGIESEESQSGSGGGGSGSGSSGSGSGHSGSSTATVVPPPPEVDEDDEDELELED